MTQKYTVKFRRLSLPLSSNSIEELLVVEYIVKDKRKDGFIYDLSGNRKNATKHFLDVYSTVLGVVSIEKSDSPRKSGYCFEASSDEIANIINPLREELLEKNQEDE